MIGGTILKLARSAAEQYVRHRSFPTLPTTLPPDIMYQRACYVTIFENPGHHLRSQYGHPLPRHTTLAEEVIMNTIAAIDQSTQRPFRPVDLSYLGYAVLVLGSLERISRPEHLNPVRWGLYLRSDRNKNALILPGRVGIETPDDQIATAFRESQINPREEATTMYRFAVTAYED